MFPSVWMEDQIWCDFCVDMKQRSQTKFGMKFDRSLLFSLTFYRLAINCESDHVCHFFEIKLFQQSQQQNIQTTLAELEILKYASDSSCQAI